MNFLEIKNKRDLTKFLQLSEKQFDYVFYYNKNRRYKTVVIPKLKGIRILDVPSPFVKIIQNRLLLEIEKIYKPKSVVYGFVKGKDIKGNAKAHLGNKYLLNLDLLDFFCNINFGRIRGLFRSKPFSFNLKVANYLAHIATNQKGVLPQGSPLSPILSNMIAYIMDQEIIKQIKGMRITYTRYADDITFSSSSINSLDDAFLEKIKIIISNSGFSINDNKTRFSRIHDRKEVTGLIINKHVNIPREFYYNTKAMIYNSKIDLEQAAITYRDKNNLRVNSKVFLYKGEKLISWFLKVIEGRINYIMYILGKTNWKYLRLAQDYNDLINDDRFDVKKYTKPNDWISEQIFVLEYYKQTKDNLDCTQGTAIYLGNRIFLTAAHTIINEATEIDIYSEINSKTKINNQIHNIEVIFRDDNFDIALIKVSEYNLKSQIQISKQSIDTGLKHFIAGYPNHSKGASATIYEGIVIGNRFDEYRELIKTDAQIIKGMSGGAVFNSEMDLIGMIVRGNETKDGNHFFNEFIIFNNLPIELIRILSDHNIYI